ncbi:MAG: aminotransferase class I/II-fold pyridoxal phosphate-dependent enzyme [Armatimonadetes bacterium]|nr:aminotransferase class I/II-fold pyridoxal phosphate-dependent enzyme [Armatimonadota bacterium]
MVVDLRSDTVTQPSAEMIRAMASAPLGDDVLGDDPTVKELESLAAAAMGKEAGLFVPSGTMGNQIALCVHCRPGDAVLFEEQAHMVWYEGGAPAVFAGVLTKTVPGTNGIMSLADIESRITRRNYHTPGTVLLCIENTHNRAGGAIVPPDLMEKYQTIATENAMATHLDGARIFNASVALGAPVQKLTKSVDTVNFCLSKALGAPVGSVLCGPAAFIEEAKYVRKRMGGGMRQSGILAAAGIYALEHNVDRLAEDHLRAKALGAGLAEIPGLSIQQEDIVTNFVMVDTVLPVTLWVEAISRHGVKAIAFGPHRVRLVLHYHIDDQAVAQCIDAFRTAASEIGA